MEEELPIGIDLGTTNTVIGVWNKNEVVIIPNTIGEKFTPSVVYFKEENIIVGEQTENFLPDADKKIYATKRIIGKSYKDKELEKDIEILQYKNNIIKDKERNIPVIKVDEKGVEKLYTPENISSLILKKVVKDARKFLHRSIKNVVITSPAYFNDTQRNCTKKAAEDIGLKVLRIINEPTAAALSYGLGKKYCPLKTNINTSTVDLLKASQLIKEEQFKNPYTLDCESFCLLGENNNRNNEEVMKNSIFDSDSPKNLLVFDLGGGTFDLTIIRIEKNNLEVKTTMGDRHLGGEDFDYHLVDYFLKNFCSKMNLKIEEIKKNNKNSIARLKIACEHVKRILSLEEETNLKLDNFINDSDLLEKITRQQFETEICVDLFNKIPVFFPIILNEAHMTNKDIDEIILVGGSTKIPKIKSILKYNFPNSKINDSINADEIVAYGATIQAAIILQEDKKGTDIENVFLLDKTSFSYGTDIVNDSEDPVIREKGSKMSFLIPKGKTIPYTFTKGYKTAFDNQTNMSVGIYEGESEYTEKNNHIGYAEVKGIPKRPMGKFEVNITFSIDVNNILKVIIEDREKLHKLHPDLKIELVKENQKNNASIKTSGSIFSKLQQFEINNSQITDKNYLRKYCQEYRKENNKELKLKILQNYKETLLNIINKFEPNNFNNEKMIEEYYIYVSQLFLSYNEELKLKYEMIKKNNLEDEIFPKIIQYLEIFKNKSLYYIKNLVNIFKNSPKESDIFYRIIAYTIETFNQIGQGYLDENQQFSRYKAKLYFGEAIKLYDENIKNIISIIPVSITKKINEQNDISIQRLKEINTNALLLIKLTQDKKEIFDQAKFETEFGFSGFTLFKNKFNLSVQRTIEEYNIALDAFEKALVELETSQNYNNYNNDNNIQEGKAICKGCIVKINLDYLKNKNYKRYKILIDDCISIAEDLGKNNKECSWYNIALELNKKIENELRKKEEEFNKIWSDQWEPRLTQIKKTLDNLFSKSNKMEFINYILDEYPYKGYVPSDNTTLTYNKSLISNLRNKYHLDHYAQNTLEEKFNYSIFRMISEKLNNLYDRL